MVPPPPRGSPYEYALNLLGARAYSVRDLTNKLRRRGFAGADVAPAITRLLSAGLLDDARFAEQLARGKIVNDLISGRRVAQLLSRKGIDRATANDAIARVLEDEAVDQRASAERLARRRVSSLAGLERVVVRRRLFGFLARRGYDLDDIRAVLERVL